MTKTHSLLNNNNDERLEALGNFLRKRREQIKPEDVGITTTGRRRTPGLRREELAQLAGVSVSWYTWLEQGRDISVSDDVLKSIARVLKLEPSEKAHLYQLAKKKEAVATEHSLENMTELQQLLTSFGSNPVYILDKCWNLVLGNQNAYNLFVPASVSNYEELSWREKNLIWGLFTNPYQKELLVDWEVEDKRSVELFRYSSSDYISEKWYIDFINELKEISPQFETWWNDYAIQSPDSKIKHLYHPEVGELVFRVSTLLIPEFPELQLVVYTPTEVKFCEKLLKLLEVSRELPSTVLRDELGG